MKIPGNELDYLRRLLAAELVDQLLDLSVMAGQLRQVLESSASDGTRDLAAQIRPVLEEAERRLRLAREERDRRTQ